MCKIKVCAKGLKKKCSLQIHETKIRKISIWLERIVKGFKSQLVICKLDYLLKTNVKTAKLHKNKTKEIITCSTYIDIYTHI